jgi:hypothetical protein
VQEGWTPLHFAAQNGHGSVIKALVAAKADVHAKTRVRDGRRGAAWRERGGRRRVCILLMWSGFLNMRLLKDPIP